MAPKRQGSGAIRGRAWSARDGAALLDQPAAHEGLATEGLGGEEHGCARWRIVSGNDADGEGGSAGRRTGRS
jgi:hypothetical protein